ncbi:MAG: caspase family protein, partial [Hyphomicrobiaceae bacterium]
PGQAAGRFALLIGNQSYADAVGPLANPTNDINLVGAALRKVGLQISRVENAMLGGMYKALNAHTRRVRNAGKDAQRREEILVQKRWILPRNGRCTATWDDLQNDQFRKRLAQCLLQATRGRILDLR